MSHAIALRSLPLGAVALLCAASVAGSQQAKPGSAATAPIIGQLAPDFSLPGTTRYGPLRDPITLSELRGQTVVLAFFPKARTKG